MAKLMTWGEDYRPVRGPYFGPALEYWRANRELQVTIEALRAAGFAELDESAYEQVIAGRSMPRDVPDFVGALATLYGIGAREAKDLRDRAAFDILYHCQEDAALMFMPEPRPLEAIQGE